MAKKVANSTVALDAIDRALLRALQRDGRATNAQLSAAANISESSCLRRVRQMEQAGFISRYVAMLNPAMVGFGLTAIVTISLASQSQEALAAFEAAVVGVPEVLECHLMTGSSDYVLRVVVADMEALGRLHSTRLTRLPGVARVNSSLSLRCIVQRTSLPL